MLSINVKKQAENQKLIKFVIKVLPLAPQSFIHKLFRKKDVKVNGKRQKQDFIINSGDVVEIYITDIQAKEFGFQNNDNLSKHVNKLKILFEDANILAIDKPLGMLSQKSIITDYSLNDAIIEYLGCEYGFKPSIVNRLDRNTSGIVLAGKTYEGLKELNRIFRERLVDKFYLTLVHGKIKNDIYSEAKISRSDNISKVGELGSTIKTSVQPLRYVKECTLCRVQIHTGKTHQIRAHMAYLGYPLVGDRKYGSRFPIKYYLLHCEEMKIRENNLGIKDLVILAELSEDSYFIKTLRGIEDGNLGN